MEWCATDDLVVAAECRVWKKTGSTAGIASLKKQSIGG